MTHSRQCVKPKNVTYKLEYKDLAESKSKEVEMYKRKVASLEDNLRDSNHWVNVYQQKKEYVTGIFWGSIIGSLTMIVIKLAIG